MEDVYFIAKLFASHFDPWSAVRAADVNVCLGVGLNS